MKNVIPLFPLNLIVFPGSKYPLHIFEKRYKKMINRCLNEEIGFGIAAHGEDKNYGIGSYVVITEILKNYENGERDIVVKALERFIIKKLELHPDGYHIATVEPYTDTQSEIDSYLLKELQVKFEKIIEDVHFKLDDSFWTKYYGSILKSFKIAEKSGLTLTQQQNLLTMQNENARISFLIEHFEKLEAKLSESSLLKNIILSDGYLN